MQSSSWSPSSGHVLKVGSWKCLTSREAGKKSREGSHPDRKKKKQNAVSNLCLHTLYVQVPLLAARVWCSTLAVAFHWWQQRAGRNATKKGLLLISTQTALIFWCHQGWSALASEVLEHAVVSAVVAVRLRLRERVRMRERMVVVGKDRVGVRPLRMTPCCVIWLLLRQSKEGHKRPLMMYREIIISQQD